LCWQPVSYFGFGIERPLLFLPLFDSQSPQVVLVGVYTYSQSLPEDLHKEDTTKIAEAFRRLLGHEDGRLRFTAIEVLAEKKWLTADDIIRGLGDKAQCVRLAAAWKVYKLTENPAEIVYDANDKLVRGDPNRIAELLEIKRKLAPVLLEHLNDTHFYLRHQIASEFKRLFKEHIKTDERGLSVGPPPYFPKPFGWLREDWESRDRMQKQWKQWWQQHGEEAPRWAHPPQQSCSRSKPGRRGRPANVKLVDNGVAFVRDEIHD
jgi:hypothetical protein